MKLSDKIRIIRKARGFSQEGLGQNLSKVNKYGISRQTVSDWENGNCEPKLDNIRDLAQVLNVSFDALLDESIDLDDADVLNAVLKNLSTETKERVNSKFRYRIYSYDINKKNYIKVISWFSAIGLLAIVALVLLLISFNGLVSGWWAYGFGLAFLVSLSCLSIPISEVKRIKNGGYSLAFGELNNTHLIVRSTNTADNTVYVPVDKIERMELGETANEKHGPVLIYVTGRVRPMTLIDIKKPKGLIDVFNNLNSYIEDPDEIKIL